MWDLEGLVAKFIGKCKRNEKLGFICKVGGKFWKWKVWGQLAKLQKKRTKKMKKLAFIYKTAENKKKRELRGLVA